MTVLVTAAGGHLGRLTVDALRARGLEAGAIVAGARTPDKVSDLSADGIRVVALDYDQPATIAAALEGVDTVILISGSVPGQRVAGHKNVIAAAEAAGVSKLVYTSAPLADTFAWALGADHKATEEALAASGVPHVIVRNDWYTENYADDVARSAESGVIVAAVGDATVASASRKDYAEGAAVVAIEDGHLGKIYEFSGDVSWSYNDLAAAASDIVGRDVVYTPVSTDELISGLKSAGLSDGTAAFVASMDAGIAGGVLSGSDGTLSRLIGHPTTPLVEGLREALAAAKPASA